MTTLETIARKYGFSLAAAETVREALRVGHGTMAQFDHPELGGYGQWMKGGMLQIGDMFNDPLKGRVAGLINDIAALPESSDDSSSSWWPKEFGRPSMVSGQNNVRYAYFPAASRLVVEEGKVVSIYDTTGLTIYGVSQQQQGNTRNLVVNTSAGPIPADKLPRM
jgi:hypothetical protein